MLLHLLVKRYRSFENYITDSSACISDYSSRVASAEFYQQVVHFGFAQRCRKLGTPKPKVDLFPAWTASLNYTLRPEGMIRVSC